MWETSDKAGEGGKFTALEVLSVALGASECLPLLAVDLPQYVCKEPHFSYCWPDSHQWFVLPEEDAWRVLLCWSAKANSIHSWLPVFFPSLEKVLQISPSPWRSLKSRTERLCEIIQLDCSKSKIKTACWMILVLILPSMALVRSCTQLLPSNRNVQYQTYSMEKNAFHKLYRLQKPKVTKLLFCA